MRNIPSKVSLTSKFNVANYKCDPEKIYIFCFLSMSFTLLSPFCYVATVSLWSPGKPWFAILPGRVDLKLYTSLYNWLMFHLMWYIQVLWKQTLLTLSQKCWLNTFSDLKTGESSLNYKQHWKFGLQHGPASVLSIICIVLEPSSFPRVFVG